MVDPFAVFDLTDDPVAPEAPSGAAVAPPMPAPREGAPHTPPADHEDGGGLAGLEVRETQMVKKELAR